MRVFAEFHDELRDVATRVFEPSRPHHHHGDAAPPIDWDTFVAAGWPGLEFAESLGGAGATFAETAIVLVEHGRAVATSGLIGTSTGVGALLDCEPSARRDELLRDVAAGSTRLALALEGAGAPAFRVADGRLTGTAPFVLDAADADVVLVPAEADDVPVLVAVGVGDVDVEVVPVVDPSRRIARVTADGVAVHDHAALALDGEGAGGRMRDRASLAIACDCLGLAEAMVAATVAYAGQRRQFDRPIGSFQAVKHLCADMHVRLSIARELLDDAIEAIVARRPDTSVAVAMAAAYLGDAAVTVAGDAMQLHGGIGYTWESGVHVYLKRAILDRALYGSPADHRRRIAARYVTPVWAMSCRGQRRYDE